MDLKGNHNLIVAAKEAGVKQFIFVSAGTANANSPVPFLQAKEKPKNTFARAEQDTLLLLTNAYMEFCLVNLGLLQSMENP